MYCRWKLTCAPMISRVRVPPLICSTHCCHPPSWNKHWITHEQYLSSLSCVLIWLNGAIDRRSRITAVDWRVKIDNGDDELLHTYIQTVYKSTSFLFIAVKITIHCKQLYDLLRQSLYQSAYLTGWLRTLLQCW